MQTLGERYKKLFIMSRKDLGSNSLSTITNLQDFCSKAEYKKPSFLVQDLLPVPYSKISSANSSSSSSFTTDSSSLPTSPQLSESDSSQETGLPDYRILSSPLPKKNRSSFSSDQLCELERAFEQKQYLSSKERQQLALSLRMTDKQVKTWFQNRRMKRKRKRTEETQYYTKLAFANRLVSGASQQPYFLSYQPPLYPGYTSHPPAMQPSLSPEHQGILRSSSSLYPGRVELSHPASPPPEYPGIRLSYPSLCRECPGTDCKRACAPHFSYPPGMSVYSSPDYSILH